MLGQLCPTSTSAETIWTAVGEESIFGLVIIINNNTASTVLAKVFIDPDGSVADTTTQIEKSITANSYGEVLIRGQVDFKDGTIGVQSATANALTFHAMKLA